MMYELTIETKGYNRCVFVFDRIGVLTNFLETALERAVDKDTKAIIKIKAEGGCENEV